MRLTEKDEQYVGGYCCIGNPNIEWKEKAYSKLGQLEDIEDELGIDLITLFKALTQDIYVKRDCYNLKGYYIDKVKIHTFNLEYKAIYLEETCEYQYPYYFKDYGKTWALTKEELL